MQQGYDISIIIPCYNVGRYISDCLNSVINLQSSLRCQIICINDGSRDNTLEILDNYKKRLSDCIVINQENRGLSYSRNIGMEVASGKWVLFLDSDDMISAEELIGLFAEVENSNADVCCGEYYNLIDSEVFRKTETIPPLEDISGLDFLNRYYFKSQLSMVWRYIYRRDFLLENKFEFTPNVLFEDMEFTPKVLVKTQSLKYIKKPFYYYRQRSASIMNSTFTSKKINDSFLIALSNLTLGSQNEKVFHTMIRSARYIILRAILLYRGDKDDIDFKIYENLRSYILRINDKRLLHFLNFYYHYPKTARNLLKTIQLLKTYFCRKKI